MICKWNEGLASGFFVAIVFVLICIVSGCGTGAGDAEIEPVAETLHVAGMTCESCEQAIVKTVGQMDGVEMVESRHVTGTTTVLYRPDKVRREAIVEAIEGMGYAVVSQEG